MRYWPVLCLLFASLVTSLAWAQDQPTPPAPDVPPEYRPPILRDDDDAGIPASARKVAPDAAVITISGVCSRADLAPKTPCQTVITRAEFEKLTEALLTNMRFSRKRSLANAYPNLLAMAREAEARGIDKTTRFQERMAFARVQILSQELVRQIGDEARAMPEKDIEDYYQSHADDFSGATLERIFIPNRKRGETLPKDKTTPEALAAERKASEDAMTREADALRARAVAGEPFLTLQKEAYEAAGLSDVPPNPSLGQVHAAGLPSQHASVFDLKPGEVSQILSDSTGHYIYKLDAKTIEPLQNVKDEIRKTLANQRQEEAIQSVQRPVTTEFNQAYFGPGMKPRQPDENKSQ